MNSTTNKSIFSDWSPLPERKLFCSRIDQDFSKETEKDLYPNYDVTGFLRSCTQEIVEPLQGTPTGTIPAWLQGSLYRNGPGSLKVANMEFEHLFDSSALLHRFALQNGNVTYQCRFLQSEVYKRNKAAQRIVVTEFGTASVPDPCQSIFHRISAQFDTNNQTDNSMISVYPFGDEIYAFAEIPVIHKVNKLTLDTENRVDVSKYVSIVHHTSHPHVEKDGSVYNLGTSVTALGTVHNIIKFPNGDKNMFEEAKIVASVPVRWQFHPSYMHSFGITENYFVIVEHPLNISTCAVLMNKLKNKPMIGNFKWFKDEMTQINVISRKTGKSVQKFYSETFFFMHIINQYERESHLVLDICCYRDPSMLDCMYVDAMKRMQHNPDYARMFRGRPLRFVLPLQYHDNRENLVSITNTKCRASLLPNGDVFVQPEVLCHLGCETPRIHYEKYLGREYQYFYALSSDVDSENPASIIKVDTINKSPLTWCEPNCYPSEPVFVPHPNSKAEDDGVILSALVWGKDVTHRVGLLILNAKDMQEIGRAVFDTPGEVPRCLHGWFCRADQN